MSDQYEREIATIESVENAPPLKKFLAYSKLSGPGWLQGAISLGGGSLASALYLGVIAGYGLMWLQPLAMICGIIMLSAIAYVTLSTEARPFGLINRHLHPILGWAWLIGAIMANIVWTMPQFALGTGALQQNLGILPQEKFVPLFCVVLFLVSLGANWLYETGGKGAKAFDLLIKIMVGIVVLSFIVVAITLLGSGQLNFGKVLGGFFPDLSLLFKPAEIYEPLIAQSAFPDFWRNKIVTDQQDVIVAAFATAVGINMTFLLPYSLLKKRRGPKYRGLTLTDLSIGLFIPFFLATSCVVIAAANSFHGKADDLPEGAGAKSLLVLVDKEADFKEYSATLENQNLAPEVISAREQTYAEEATASLGTVEKELAALLVERDAGALALTLEPFAGPVIAQKVFGVGVFGMAISTIIILMLINGLAFQEAFSKKRPEPSPGEKGRANINDSKPLFFIGCAVSGLMGACYPLFWTGDSKAALAVPTSVIGGSLIPIAYFTFFLMMNSKKILGDARPEGKARIIWNTLMIFATIVATLGSVWVLEGKASAPGWVGGVATGGLVFLVILFIVGTVSFLKNEKRTDA